MTSMGFPSTQETVTNLYMPEASAPVKHMTKTLTEGTKYDGDKVRIELFPGEALFAISQVLTFGAKKYADRNWEKGIKWSRVFGACMRHMWCWWQGKSPTSTNFVFGELDPETQFSHLWHAGCCIAFLISYEERKMSEFDDRPQ